MSATGSGGPGPGPGPATGSGSGASNPRKFSEKIALHTQRQAEETAAFQEVMMDITSTRLQAQKLRLARNQGPYYGGSLPNVNQIGRNPQDFQGPFQSGLESSRSTRHHGLVERVQRDRRFVSPVRPYRNRPVENSLYSAAYLSPPPDASWRRIWSGSFPGDKSQSFRLPSTALSRTNSDSALHTSVMNPPMGDFSMAGPGLTPQGGRRSGPSDTDSRRMFPYPVPPIEENVLDEDKLLKSWDAKKLSLPSSRPKSCEVPGINIFASPEQPSTPVPGVPAAPNPGGSLPDLSSLHFPSPLPTPLDRDEPGYPASSAPSGGSTGNLASTLTQMGITAAGNGGYQQPAPGLLASLQSTLSSPNLQSSLSNPNLQSSLSSHSFSSSLSSASLHSSLSNPSLQSSLSSSSSQSLHSSLSSSSLQYGAGSSPYSALLSTSPRRRAQLSPLILPMAGETRRPHPKQFSPTVSPTLSSISQGVPLDTSRLPPYALGQPGQQNPALGQNQQQMLRLQQPRTNQQQLHLQNLRNQQQFGPLQRPMGQQQNPPVKSESALDPCSQYRPQPDQNQQAEQLHLNLNTDFYNDELFSSLLDDPDLSLQLNPPQFPAESPVDGLNHSGPGQNQFLSNSQGALELQEPGDPQWLNHQNQNQNRNYSGGDGRQNLPNIILTGDPSPGLSKEVASALSHVPGFSLDEPLRIDPLALDLLEGELVLADPAVEDSFRSDRLQ